MLAILTPVNCKEYLWAWKLEAQMSSQTGLIVSAAKVTTAVVFSKLQVRSRPITGCRAFVGQARNVCLEALEQSCRVELFTNSKYLRNGITAWIGGWKARGWKTVHQRPVKNVDLCLDASIHG